MGLSQNLFGEGNSNQSDAGVAAENYNNGAGGNTTYFENTSSNTGTALPNDPGIYTSAGQPNTPEYNAPGTVSGADLANNDASTSTPGIDPMLYSNAMNLAQAQATNYEGLGNAAYGRTGPTINNANAGQSQANLAGINQGYAGLEGSLQNTANGGGVNAGQAQFNASQGGVVGAAMAAGSNHHNGGMQTQLGGAGAGFGGAAGQAAATRGGQIAAAQSGLAGAYNAQGGMNLNTYGNEQQNAQEQATLQGAQNAQNDQLALQYYGLAQAQQNASQSALDTANQEEISTGNAGTAHQSTVNQQTNAEIGEVAGFGGSAVTAII